ncbi:DUF1990 domain-containing protein [Mycolicibacterium fortuitum]|uniref:DUF1990 family protein n=1 Tax=Mycolicibacterium TaxID=1866885 RepID=UPI0007EDD837|nr:MULTISPECIES: DUF1990 domain-containing protein [Mycolicibacterium]OBK09618.1 hypothetical protein A5637_29345 [Mycolicibacterium fortuitum]
MPTFPAELTYTGASLTAPAHDTWAANPPNFRRFEHTVVVGHGDAVWIFATAEVMKWGIKRRSGFDVTPDSVAKEGTDYCITARWGPVVVHEPVRVVAVVDKPDRRGFAYGTKLGHPVCGEEAFIVHRNAAGTVFLTLRSLTRPAPEGPWRPLFPALLIAQRFFRRRYLQALTT